MTDNEKNYWRSEYENLRRKKNKEIDRLKFQISKHNDELYEYLNARGLVNDYINYKKGLTNESL